MPQPEPKRLTPEQIALLFVELENKGAAAEAAALRAHLDARDDALTILELQREQLGVTAATQAALDKVTEQLSRMAPVYERAVAALDRLADAEEEGNRLEAKRQETKTENNAQEQETKRAWISEVWKPLVGALAGAVAAVLVAGASGCTLL